MKKTSISFKTFLIAAALTSPFVAEAGSVKAQLQQINNNLDVRLNNMEVDFSNQDDNRGPTQLRADYKRRFAGQLAQLKSLLAQATNVVNSGNFGGGTSRRASRRTSAEDLRIAPMITNAIANMDRLGQLNQVEPETLDDAEAFLQAIKPGSDQRLSNQIDAALGILNRR